MNRGEHPDGVGRDVPVPPLSLKEDPGEGPSNRPDTQNVRSTEVRLGPDKLSTLPLRGCGANEVSVASGD